MSITNKEKISQLLNSNDKANKYLGIEQLVSMANLDLMQHFLNQGTAMSETLGFYLVPFFQQHSDKWKAIRRNINSKIRQKINFLLPQTILYLNNPSLETFCDVVTSKMREDVPDFIALSPSILTSNLPPYERGYGYFSSSGEIKKGEMCWNLSENSKKITKKEYQYQWVAYAYHPIQNRRFKGDYQTGHLPEVWMSNNKK